MNISRTIRIDDSTELTITTRLTERFVDIDIPCIPI